MRKLWRDDIKLGAEKDLSSYSYKPYNCCFSRLHDRTWLCWRPSIPNETVLSREVFGKKSHDNCQVCNKNMDADIVQQKVPGFQDRGTTIIPRHTGKYVLMTAVLVIYTVLCSVTLKYQDYTLNSNFVTTRKINRLQSVSPGMNGMKKYSYGTANSDSKSLISYTDKTLREINQVVSSLSLNWVLS